MSAGATCLDCGRTMRRYGSPKRPGTVVSNGRRCTTCSSRRYEADRAARGLTVERNRTHVEKCSRCGATEESERYWRIALCSSCREVVPHNERPAWRRDDREFRFHKMRVQAEKRAESIAA